MIAIRGRKPEPSDNSSASRLPPRRRHFGIRIVVALLLGPLAATGAPLTLGEAEALAVDADPMHTALAARAAALDANAVIAEALPDPALRVGLNNYPIDGSGFDGDGMTNAGLVYRQAFPPGRTRQYRHAMFERQGDALRHDLDGRVRDVRLLVRELWLALWFADRTEERLTEARPYFENLASVTRSLYAVGRRNQQDVLRAELELGRLEDRLIGVSTEIATRRARLGEWIGDAASRPLPSDPPTLPSIPDLPALEAQLAVHPLLQSADAAVAAREANVKRADERSKPGWAVDVGYGYREGLQPSGMPRSDVVTVGVTLELPWFNRRSVDAELSAALAEQRAAEATRAELGRRLRADLLAEHARFEELGRRLALFDERILKQSAASADAAFNAYRSDAADFADVMRARIGHLDAQVEVLRIELERALSQVRLARLGGL